MTNYEVIRRLTPDGELEFILEAMNGDIDWCRCDCSAFFPESKMDYEGGDGCYDCMRRWLDSNAEAPRGLWDSEERMARFTVEKNEEEKHD